MVCDFERVGTSPPFEQMLHLARHNEYVYLHTQKHSYLTAALKWDIAFYKRVHQQSSMRYNSVYMYSRPLSIFVSLFSLSFTPNTHTAVSPDTLLCQTKQLWLGWERALDPDATPLARRSLGL